MFIKESSQKKQNGKGRQIKEKENAEGAKRKQGMYALMKAKNASLLAKEICLGRQEVGIINKSSCVGELLKKATNKNNKADISADQLMTETTTRLSEKLSNKLAEVRVKQIVESRKRKFLN